MAQWGFSKLPIIHPARETGCGRFTKAKTAHGACRRNPASLRDRSRRRRHLGVDCSYCLDTVLVGAGDRSIDPLSWRRGRSLNVHAPANLSPRDAFGPQIRRAVNTDVSDCGAQRESQLVSSVPLHTILRAAQASPLSPVQSGFCLLGARLFCSPQLRPS